VAAALPELATARLVVRLARPGMQAAMARFLAENFEGHLDRWSPPATSAFFTEAFWRDRLGAAVDEYAAGRAARFVLQPAGGAIDAEVIGTCNYTNIVRGPFLACHLGYQIARAHEGRGLMAEALRATNAFAFRELKLVVEPGGAIGLAALLAGRPDVKGKVVVAVLSGGNIDPELFHRLVA